jgi:HAD superfamily hydrolase (TIGR01490 family)
LGIVPVSELVLVDLDGTLTRRDTYLPYLLGWLRLHPERLPGTWPLPSAVVMHALRFRDNTWLKTTFLKAVCAGCPRDALVAYGGAFAADVVARGLRKGARARLQQHRAAGDRLVLVSASLDLYVEALAARLDFDAVLCTPAATDAAGRLTGGLAGPNCYGAGKLARVRAWLAETGWRDPIRCYSDHHSDLPLLGFVDRPVAVNPTPRLVRQAARAGIPVENWDVDAPHRDPL